MEALTKVVCYQEYPRTVRSKRIESHQDVIAASRHTHGRPRPDIHATGQPDRSASRLTQRIQVTTCKFNQQLWQRHSKPPKPKHNGQPDRSERRLTSSHKQNIQVPQITASTTKTDESEQQRDIAQPSLIVEAGYPVDLQATDSNTISKFEKNC
jgi:hypothetical protein